MVADMSLFVTTSLARLQQRAGLSDGPAPNGQGQPGEPGLRRVLSRADLVLIGIGGVIGAGIFVLTGQAAGAHAGPAIVLSMLLAGVVSALAGLCYAELASSVPVAGSAYTYAYVTLGELVAWIIGWDLVLEYALSAATVAVSWSGHLTSFLRDIGLPFPAALSGAPGTLVPVAGGDPVTAVLNLPAVLLVLAVTVLLIVGVKESTTMNAVMVAIKVTVITLVVVGGVWFVLPENLTPFLPPNTGTFGEYGWSGVMRGAAVIFFAYIGFDAVSVSAQEARNPQRDMPVGILGSLAICTLLYMLVSGVMVGLADYTVLKGSPAPMVVALDAAIARHGGAATWLTALKWLVEIGALAGLTSVVTINLMAQPRIFYAMAADGLLPRWAGHLHPRWKTPHVGTIVTGLAVAVAAGLTPVDVLGHLVSIGTLFAFAVVSIGVLVLRRTSPDLPRPFRVPFVPALPIASVVVCLALMASLPWETWERLFIWLAIGLVIYAVYGYRHSVARREATR
jgi:APA family basic amino acid/polyamine antiporter